MALISIPEVTVYKRIEVKVLPRPDVPGAKPWMTSGELLLLKAQHDRRRVVNRTILVLGLVILGCLGLLELSQSVLAAAPAKAALAEQVARVAQQALETFSTPTVPLAISSASTVLEQKVSRSHQHYHVTVVLRLLQPLYLPAHSNGTLEYEQLRIGLANARSRPQSDGLPGMGGIPAELPPLVQRSHFAGETTRITTTLEAIRSGWRWKFSPVNRSTLVCRRQLQGSILSAFPNALVYDEIRPDPALRARLDEIRAFLSREAGAVTATPKTRGGQP